MPEACPLDSLGHDIWAENAPQVVFFRHAYERYGMQQWNNHRVSKLAADLNCTLWTLCAWAGCFVAWEDNKHCLVRLKLDVKLIRKCWGANSWPTHLVVNFERLENAVRAKNTKDLEGMFFGKIDKLGVQLLTGKFEEI